MADVLNQALIQARGKAAIGGPPPAALVPTLRLFVNNVGVGDTTTQAQLVECTAPGYAPIPLTYATWSQSYSAAQFVGSYPVQQFQFAGPGAPAQTVYGHYVTDANLGLLWGLTWSAPFPIPVGNSFVQVTPQWVDKQC